MRDQLVTETIDAKILRLVGLEETFDLDYDTYLILLREAQVKGRDTLPQEELAVLANERKRVRGKVGRFKPKAKSINVNNITSIGRMGQKLLPAGRGVGSAPIVKSLESIGKIVESISENLSDQSKEDRKGAEENRKEEENKKRETKEKSLEAGTKKVIAAAKKLFAPIRGIFDAIFNYVFYTFLGRGINEALTWLANPENKKKVAALGQFIKDFWPALLVTAGLFFTPLGSFIRTIIGQTALIGIRVPLVTAAVLGYVARQREIERVKPLVGKTEKTLDETLKSKEAPWYQKLGAYFGKEALNKPGGPKDSLPFSLPGAMYASGGFIDQNTGLKISGAGPDTQLTALQPGEIVMNRAAVKAIGAGNLLNLNGMFGGPNANKPKFANNIQLSANGGMVGKGLRGADLMRIMHGTSSSAAESIRSTGFREQTGMLGKGVYGSLKGWVADTYRGAGLAKGIMPGKGSRLDMLVPNTARTLRGATVVSSKQANRGLSIAEGILSGKYTGAKAQSLMPLLTKSTPTMMKSLAFGATRLLGKALGVLNAPVVGDMLFPEAAGSSSTLQEASKRGYYKGPIPGPSSKGKPNVITLPPTIENASSPTRKASGSEIPSFSAVAPGNRRMENAQIYGIVP